MTHQHTPELPNFYHSKGLSAVVLPASAPQHEDPQITHTQKKFVMLQMIVNRQQQRFSPDAESALLPRFQCTIDGQSFTVSMQFPAEMRHTPERAHSMELTLTQQGRVVQPQALHAILADLPHDTPLDFEDVHRVMETIADYDVVQEPYHPLEKPERLQLHVMHNPEQRSAPKSDRVRLRSAITSAREGRLIPLDKAGKPVMQQTQIESRFRLFESAATTRALNLTLKTAGTHYVSCAQRTADSAEAVFLSATLLKKEDGSLHTICMKKEYFNMESAFAEVSFERARRDAIIQEDRHPESCHTLEQDVAEKLWQIYESQHAYEAQMVQTYGDEWPHFSHEDGYAEAVEGYTLKTIDHDAPSLGPEQER